ncbi:integrase/recombinase XerD [Anoxybacillus calidus]|uniref:Integrase/recombinase XerD n=1 Tax=[Anoxybacillus] calidus TaxID=575178 RepID=A0A7V9YWY3_9BACL|nr:tyrosine-type recombinase/integrase [Anoxybacillus calidus]MBA2869959.1 integrase/recombinase XerD [Anoxybacillus calidus]
MSDFDIQLDNFMLYCDAKNLSRKTKASYEQTLRLFFLYLEEQHKIKQLKKVKPLHIRAYIKYLRERGKYTVISNLNSVNVNYPTHRTDYQKPISDTTIANYVRNIKVFFNFLYKEREIKENPCDNIENVKPQRKQKALLSEEDIVKLLKAFDITTFHGYRSWVQTRLILDTGMRAGECCAIRPEHVDFKTKSILIENPKNRKQRYVYFSFKMANDLKRWMKYRDRFSDSPFLFPTIRGTMLDVNNFERMLKETGKKVGVEVTPHQLRNNFAKYYLLNGGDWVTLSRILGHSSAEVTQKAYLDFTEGEVARKYQKHSPLNHLDV